MKYESDSFVAKYLNWRTTNNDFLGRIPVTMDDGISRLVSRNSIQTTTDGKMKDELPDGIRDLPMLSYSLCRSMKFNAQLNPNGVTLITDDDMTTEMKDEFLDRKCWCNVSYTVKEKDFSEMIDKDKIVDMPSRIHDRDIPDNRTKLPGEFYEDILDNTVHDEEVQSLFKSAVTLFFKKLGDIITAVSVRIIDLFGGKK